MSDTTTLPPGWLTDKPTTWHEVGKALQDISVLLQYLGGMPDARLLSYFGDPPAQPGGGTLRATVPPCKGYASFLNRLFDIEQAYQTGSAPSDPAGDGLSAVAFVYWTRDFLAAVAAPATADSIRLTQAFLVNRAWSRYPFRRQREDVPVARPGRPALPPLPPDLGAPTRNLLARKLAVRVRLYEILTIAVLLTTFMVSVYALTGRLILANQHDAQEQWSKLDSQLETLEEKTFKPVVLPLARVDVTQFAVTSFCDLKREVPDKAAWTRQAAALGGVQADATPENGAPPAPGTYYALAQAAHLCADRDKLLLDLFVVTMHLQSWSSAVTQHMPISALLGVVPATLATYAHEGGLCEHVDRSFARDSGWEGCRDVLWKQINRSRNVAQSVLGSITQYILPVMYGFLGAMAAAMRSLRRKVDANLLSYTDRPRLQQGAILGILSGGVIGLFASYVGQTDTASGLGIAALAFLAGYNVDGLFRFLDELSDRLFRPSTSAAK